MWVIPTFTFCPVLYSAIMWLSTMPRMWNWGFLSFICRLSFNLYFSLQTVTKLLERHSRDGLSFQFACETSVISYQNPFPKQGGKSHGKETRPVGRKGLPEVWYARQGRLCSSCCIQVKSDICNRAGFGPVIFHAFLKTAAEKKVLCRRNEDTDYLTHWKLSLPAPTSK